MTIPAIRRSSRLLNATKAVHATDSLTRLIACSVAAETLESLAAAVDRDRLDSELATINTLAAHDQLTTEVSSALAAILLHAQEAARVSGGLVDPVVGISGDVAPTGGQQDWRGHAPYFFDADHRVLHVRRGTVLDLWNIGCAWAAEEIVAQVIVQDPAASLAVVVGPAVVSVGAAWEIGEALSQEYAALQPPLRCGLRSFAVLQPGSFEALPEHTDSQAGIEHVPHAGGPWWDRAAVGAEDAIQAVTFALMAQRLGDSTFEHIVRAGGQAEFVGPRGGTPLRRRLRTPGWVPRES
ncbi:FAD:protein FMN transferase [Kocuria sp.]|uniref:FAD:protein FMN transferase n=1 Tax=Kocuria sp. TaxID=1871328 RepID=UPI0026DECFDD|nr:FAD:protein FMN transferase [Kocuria sp.]MDO5618662.1 FAD:protein FMN transferase [Kocuria sp.]